MKLTFKKSELYRVLPKLLEYLQSLDENEYEITVEKKRKKRSRNANNYLWELCTQIADKLNLTKEEVYRDNILKMGVYKEFHNMEKSCAETFRKAWSMLGVGWVTEQVDYEQNGEHLFIRAYYGSSQYNTKQMSRLLNAVIQDANAIGIETVSEREKSLLMEDWNEKVLSMR